MDLPAHPEADDPQREREPASRTGNATMVVIGLLAALVVLVVLLHLTGVVGPAAH